MQFLKVFGLLSFLVISNLAFALVIYEELYHQEASPNPSQFQEELLGLGDSKLIGHTNIISPQPISPLSAEDFFFRGLNSVTKANSYLCYAATIKPGLDRQEIIFPFHTFL